MINTSTLLVTAGDGYSSAYDLSFKPDGTNFLLRYSGIVDGWTEACKGKKAMRLRDTGNGIEVTMKDRKVTFGYDDIERLQLIMRLWEEYKEDDVKTQVFEISRVLT